MQTSNEEQGTPWHYRCTNGHEFGRPVLKRGHRRLPKAPGSYKCPRCESCTFEQVYWEMGYQKVDGTYPHDQAEGDEYVWQTVRDECEDGRNKCGHCDICRGRLSTIEAAGLLGTPLHPLDLQSLHDEGSRPTRYLFLNKGFLVLAPSGCELHPDRPSMRVDPLALMLAETSGHPHQATAWPVGTRALYVHDGKYSVIEKII